MRTASRVLALASLAVFGLGLYFDISLYLKDPYPRGILFHPYLVFFGGLGLLPALIGSGLAAWLAAASRKWGWLAGLLVASGAGLAFLSGAAMDHPPPVVSVPIAALSGAFDHALGLTTSSPSSPYVQAAAVTLPLVVVPLTLLCYSFSRASGKAQSPSPERR